MDKMQEQENRVIKIGAMYKNSDLETRKAIGEHMTGKKRKKTNKSNKIYYDSL